MRFEKDFDMDRFTLWLSLVGGISILLYGLKNLYERGDWVLVILGGLIIGFTVTSMAKKKKQ